MNPSAIYITGSGKCGTHLVGNYFEANGAGCEVERKELKRGPMNLDGRLRDGVCFVFHCPGVDIENFQSRVPDGKIVVIMTHDPTLIGDADFTYEIRGKLIVPVRSSNAPATVAAP